jgi:hypothetical protein
VTAVPISAVYVDGVMEFSTGATFVTVTSTVSLPAAPCSSVAVRVAV